MPRATKVSKCQNKVFSGSFPKTLFSFFSTLAALRPPTDGNLIALFAGEQEAGEAKRAFGVRQGNREPSRQGLDFPEKERNWPFAAEDGRRLRNAERQPVAEKQGKYAVAFAVSRQCEQLWFLYFVPRPEGGGFKSWRDGQEGFWWGALR